MILFVLSCIYYILVYYHVLLHSGMYDIFLNQPTLKTILDILRYKYFCQCFERFITIFIVKL